MEPGVILVGVCALIMGVIGCLFAGVHYYQTQNSKQTVTRWSQWSVSLNLSASILLVAFLALYWSR